MKSKVKVLQVLYSGLGGHASVVFSLIDGDIEKKWNHSLLFYGIETLVDEYAQKATERRISFSAIKARAGKPWQSWKMFYDSLKEKEPDLILLHSSSLLIPAWWYSRRRGIKLITVEHTPNQVKRPVEKWLSVLAQYLSNAVVLLTESYYNESKKALGIHFHQTKTHIIANGIDTNFFVPSKIKRDTDNIRLGMAARFSSQKDQALLVDTMEKLMESGKKKFQLWLAGDGAELENIKKLVKEKGLEGHIFFSVISTKKNCWSFINNWIFTFMLLWEKP